MSCRIVAVKAASREATPTHSRAVSRSPSAEELNCMQVQEEVINHLLNNNINGSTNGNRTTNFLSPDTAHDERREAGRSWHNSSGNLTSSDSTPSSDNTNDSGTTTDPSPLSEPLANLGFLQDDNTNTCLYSMPIVGYEVLEERSRFTVFKIQVLHQPSGDQWFVFRRYTDFARLNKRLRGEFPGLRFALPPKRWFGDNFDPIFLEDRQLGLQAFIDNLIGHSIIRENKFVRNFFCLDNPPGPHDTLEESRAMCQSLEDSVGDLQEQLKEKDSELAVLRSQVSFLMAQQHTLIKALRLECELKDSEGDDHGSTHDLNVTLLKICEKSLEDGIGRTPTGSRNGLLRPTPEESTSPVRGNRLRPVVKSPLRRTLEKAFLSKSTSHVSLPTTTNTTTSSSGSGGFVVEHRSGNVQAEVEQRWDSNLQLLYYPYNDFKQASYP
ncbi:hypothetical protein Pmani_034210 [Petrolisthes manimaculis]|uniref:PX domain-containing protein n=1 Tax=Petrolisthes manimaculis TaxID=1843537 RepID=A0AAE1TPD3_9EUCA|nr:hypothetical protein Pmani_034210 [Petrolisthes manimaculis]